MIRPAGLLEFLCRISSLWSILAQYAVEVRQLFGQLVLQIGQSLEDGLQVVPMVLTIPLATYFHPIDVLVENLPRRVDVLVWGVVGHLGYPHSETLRPEDN